MVLHRVGASLGVSLTTESNCYLLARSANSEDDCCDSGRGLMKVPMSAEQRSKDAFRQVRLGEARVLTDLV